jgi:hypothetical protein
MGRASSLCFALRLDITHNKQTQPRRARHETQPTTNREQAACGAVASPKTWHANKPNTTPNATKLHAPNSYATNPYAIGANAQSQPSWIISSSLQTAEQ